MKPDIHSYIRPGAHAHLVGIGGVSMSPLAEVLHNAGVVISGSDLHESAAVAHLRALGIPVVIGHRGESVQGAGCVIRTAAVHDDNPEIAAAHAAGIPVFERAEAWGAIMRRYEHALCVAGTHGKTTTTSMVSLILDNAKTDPTILVGGNLAEIGGNVRVGHGKFFVTEACEYMDSFLSLRPKIEIILNIDSDHLDYFKDIDHIVNSFDRFSKLVPDDGLIVAYEANPFVNRVIKNRKNVVTFGLNENCTYYAADVTFNENGMPAFDVYKEGKLLDRIQLSVPGEHNILNALAAFACCHSLGINTDVISSTLKKYTGTQRRFDIVGVTGTGVKIVDDYAHHPTEIKATLSACQNIPHNKLWCIFQPHTYTRTIALFDQFADAFEKADKLILSEIYAAREKNIYKISSVQLAEKIKETHPDKDVMFMESFDAIADYVSENADPGDLVLTMGAGDIYKVGELILEK